MEVPPAAVTNGGDEGSTVPTLDPRAFKDDVKSLMAAHDDALGGRAGRGRQPPPTDVSIKIEAPPPPERPWAAGWGWHEPPAPPAPPDPPWQPPPPESPHYPKTLEDYARRNPAVEVGRPSQQPPPLESWPSEPLAATATTPPRATAAAATTMKSPATGGKKSSAADLAPLRAALADSQVTGRHSLPPLPYHHLHLQLTSSLPADSQAEAAVLRKSLDSAKGVGAKRAETDQFLPPPHATSRAVRHEMGVQVTGCHCHYRHHHHLHHHHHHHHLHL